MKRIPWIPSKHALLAMERAYGKNWRNIDWAMVEACKDVLNPGITALYFYDKRCDERAKEDRVLAQPHATEDRDADGEADEEHCEAALERLLAFSAEFELAERVSAHMYL